jgi:hypothetical protein
LSQPEILLSTSRLRELARLVVKYKYEGDISWLLPRTSAPATEYRDRLTKKEYDLHGELLFVLVNLHEENEIKEQRLKLLDEYVELKNLYNEIMKQAEAVPKIPPTEQEKKDYPWIRDKDTAEAQNIKNSANPINIKSRKLKAQATVVPWTLQFDEVGRAIRALKPLLGTPKYASTSYYEYEKTKVIGWRNGPLVSPRQSVENFLEATNLLLAAGIRKFNIDDDGTMRLKIRIPDEIYPQAFYTSDDPEVWRKIQNRKQDLKKIKEVSRKLDKK